MQLGIMYSLRMFIERKTGIPTELKFDGITLPNAKPFVTIEQMQNNLDYISKQREAVETTFRFQIGLYANSLSERTRKQDEIRDLFLFEEVPLYTDSGELTSESFRVDVTNEVPLTADDTSDKTKMHRLYFDVEVERISHKNKGAI